MRTCSTAGCSLDLSSFIDSPRNILGDEVRAQNTENIVLSLVGTVGFTK